MDQYNYPIDGYYRGVHYSAIEHAMQVLCRDDWRQEAPSRFRFWRKLEPDLESALAHFLSSHMRQHTHLKTIYDRLVIVSRELV